MKRLIALLVLVLGNSIYSQECDCTKNLTWAKNIFEQNDAGFNYAIEKKGKEQYALHNKTFFEKAKETNELEKCTGLIYDWMTFFRKSHIAIRLNDDAGKVKSKVNDAEIIAKFKDWETYTYDKKEFAKYVSKLKTPTLEGIWVSGPYTLGVIKKNSGYIGFVIKADGVYWKEKQVKFKIAEENKVLKSTFYFRDHSKVETDKVELIGNNHLEIGTVHLKRLSPEFKEDKSVAQDYAALDSEKPYLESLDENTLFLRIPTFDESQKKVIDSVIKANHSKIIKTRNLIIDIRNNGGGSDISYAEIIPYLYTNPIRTVNVEMYSTELNNNRMKKFMADPNWPEEDKKWAAASYEILNKKIGQFVNLDGGMVSEKKLDIVYPYPQNVGIIINQGNGSTAEEFLLAARQSKKVKLFGATTFGVLDISNMNFVPSPCNEFQMGYCLSKSLRIPDMAIDDKGIQPDYYIDNSIPKYRWIDYVQNILNQ